MRVGLIIIGDEILSGKRRDRHFAEAILLLRERGMELSWCRIIGDEPALIEDSLRQTMASPDLVFCFGGIGATPDDHTRACAARAARAAPGRRGGDGGALRSGAHARAAAARGAAGRQPYHSQSLQPRGRLQCGPPSLFARLS